MAVMKAKMKVSSVQRTEYGEELEMQPVYKSEGYGEDGLDEDNTYARFTPQGKVTLMITNPALLGKFNPGEKYYLEFTKVEASVAV